MQVTLEKLSNLQRRLRVGVPATQLDKAFANRIQKIASTAKMAGFRKGKVPLTLIKQQYGHTAYQEAMSELIQTS